MLSRTHDEENGTKNLGDCRQYLTKKMIGQAGAGNKADTNISLKTKSDRRNSKRG